jgi:hypothetical protein
MEESFIGSQGQQWTVALEKEEEEEEENDLNKVNFILNAESTYERCSISTVPKVITITWWVITRSSEIGVLHGRALKNVLHLYDIQ